MVTNEFDFGGDTFDFGGFGEEEYHEANSISISNQENEISNIIDSLKSDNEKMICELNSGNDVNLFNEFCEYYRKKCNELGIKLDENIESHLNLIISEIVATVNKNNNTNLNVTSANFEEIINKSIVVSGDPDSKIILLDSLVNMDIIHNPTSSICSIMHDYMTTGNKAEDLLIRLNKVVDIFEKSSEKNDRFSDIFGRVENGQENNQEIVKTFKDLLIYKKLSNFLKIRNKYLDEIKKSKDKCVEESCQQHFPEFSDELKQIISCGDEYQLYYHGTDSNMISSKICDEGLYMQYGEIRRTAVPDLSFPDIINYSYGHENVGRHSMVIIMFPKGENVVEINQDSSVVLAGTGQGKEGAKNFQPNYVIPSSYIYGIIDKDNKQIIKNPNFRLKENQHARS